MIDKQEFANSLSDTLDSVWPGIVTRIKLLVIQSLVSAQPIEEVFRKHAKRKEPEKKKNFVIVDRYYRTASCKFEYVKGDIFQSHADAIIAFVSLDGCYYWKKMKEHYPDADSEFQREYKASSISIGSPFVSGKVLFFPIAFTRKDKIDHRHISKCFEQLELNASYWGLKTVAIPEIGPSSCGISQTALDHILHEKLDKSDLVLSIYFEHHPEKKKTTPAKKAKKPKIEGKAINSFFSVVSGD